MVDPATSIINAVQLAKAGNSANPEAFLSTGANAGRIAGSMTKVGINETTKATAAEKAQIKAPEFKKKYKSDHNWKAVGAKLRTNSDEAWAQVGLHPDKLEQIDANTLGHDLNTVI